MRNKIELTSWANKKKKKSIIDSIENGMKEK